MYFWKVEGAWLLLDEDHSFKSRKANEQISINVQNLALLLGTTGL